MHTIGIDIGGTKIAGGLVSRRGEVEKRLEWPTNASEGGQAVMSRVIELTAELVSSASGEIEGIGVANGGQIHPETGVVLYATPLLPGWTGMRIKDILKERFGLPVRVINDARAAALGEGLFGAARGVKDFVCLTLGTGVGGGIFADGRLLMGAMGNAGSIGHMVICCGGRECNCGSRGCLEAYASGTAITARTLELAAERGLDTPLIHSIKSDLSAGARLLGEAASAGDKFALEVIREAGGYLGCGLASLINLLNPALIVIGGSVAELGDLLLDPARETASKRALRGTSGLVRIVRSELGNDAGLLGAASLIWRIKESA